MQSIARFSRVTRFAFLCFSHLLGKMAPIVNNTINTANPLHNGTLMVNARNTQVKENTMTLKSQGGCNNFIQCNNGASTACLNGSAGNNLYEIDAPGHYWSKAVEKLYPTLVGTLDGRRRPDEWR